MVRLSFVFVFFGFCARSGSCSPLCAAPIWQRGTQPKIRGKSKVCHFPSLFFISFFLVSVFLLFLSLSRWPFRGPARGILFSNVIVFLSLSLSLLQKKKRGRFPPTFQTILSCFLFLFFFYSATWLLLIWSTILPRMMRL